MALVWDLGLEHAKKYVLLAYADHADDQGYNVYPSLGRIAHKTGYSRDQIRRISRQLVEAELMVLVAPADAARRRPAEYRLTLENGKELEPFTARHTGGNTQPGGPPHPGANDPPGVGAPVPPEPSVEPSLTPTGQGEPALTWENAKTGQKQATLIAYLHKRHVERDLDPPTPRQKERLSGELRTHINRGVAKADLYFALDKIVEAKRRGQSLELYQALSDDNVRQLRAINGGRGTPLAPERSVSTAGYREFS
jgi:hypothetical protein